MQSNYRIILVGCGGMSNTWLDYIAARQDAEIQALVDVSTETAKQLAKKRDLQVPIFSELEKALSKLDANLVIDVTIPAAHKAITITALKAGCNVLGEKPMAESMEDARSVLEVANNTNNRYSIMQNRRYGKHIRAFHELLSNQSIGTVESLHADFFLAPHFGGFRDTMANPLILDMAIHTFDQARFLLDADPVSVYCHEFNPSSSWYEGNANAICIFEMSNGAVFSYRGSWCAEGLNTSWESEWRATGSQGSAKWDGTNKPTCEIIDQTKPVEFFSSLRNQEVSVEWEAYEGHWGCLDEMFASLEENRPAETDCNDNIQSMSMVFGAIESAKTGKKIYL